MFTSGSPGGSLNITGALTATSASIGSGNCSISAGGLITATDVTVTSDQRVKTNITTIEHPTTTINLLRGVYYSRIGESARKIGLIAQEVERILPEVVLNGDLKSVAYGNIVALLIEGFKELSQRISAIEAAHRT
jgi:hypothetical protein